MVTKEQVKAKVATLAAADGKDINNLTAAEAKSYIDRAMGR